MERDIDVLVVEDSENDAILIANELAKCGFRFKWRRIETAAQMRSALGQAALDLIISDYRLPQFSALDAFQVYQELGLDIPFIIVSGAAGEESAVSAMKLGAHDYVMKHNLFRLAPAVARELREAEIRRERRRAEKELAESDRSLADVLKSIQAAFFTVDSQWRCRYMN